MKTKILTLFILFFNFLVFTNLYADKMEIKKQNDGKTRISIRGEDRADLLFWIIEYSNIFPDVEWRVQKDEYRNKNYRVKQWVKEPDDMNPYSYIVDLIFDGKEDKFKLQDDKSLYIEGKIALTFIKGMALMALDQEDRFKFERNNHYGYVKISDTYPETIECVKECRPISDHTCDHVASCVIKALGKL